MLAQFGSEQMGLHRASELPTERTLKDISAILMLLVVGTWSPAKPAWHQLHVHPMSGCCTHLTAMGMLLIGVNVSVILDT